MAIYKRLIKMPDGTKQRSEVYWFKFQWKGRSIRKSTGQKNPRVARQIEAAHRTALAKSAAGIRELAPAPTFQEFTKRFLAWVEVERAEKPRTVTFYKTRVGLLLKYEPLKSMLIDQIDAGTVARFIEWRKGCARVKVIRKSKGRVEYVDSKHLVSVCGINRELAVLRRVLNVAHEWKVIPSVPRIHLLPGEKVSERNVTHEEQRAYLDAAPEMLTDFTLVAVGTGFRPEEILTMRWENVRFDPVGTARLGYVHNPKGKTIKAKRNVPMSADVRAVLQKRHEAAGSPRWGYVFEGAAPTEHLSYSAINGQHERTIQRLKDSPDTKNFPKTRIYDWRHTALTRLGESGADSFVIQKVAGHSSIITSSKYVHPTSERLEDAFDRLQAYNDRKHEKIEAAQNAG